MEFLIHDGDRDVFFTKREAAILDSTWNYADGLLIRCQAPQLRSPGPTTRHQGGINCRSTPFRGCYAPVPLRKGEERFANPAIMKGYGPCGPASGFGGEDNFGVRAGPFVRKRAGRLMCFGDPKPSKDFGWSLAGK